MSDRMLNVRGLLTGGAPPEGERRQALLDIARNVVSQQTTDSSVGIAALEAETEQVDQTLTRLETRLKDMVLYHRASAALGSVTTDLQVYRLALSATTEHLQKTRNELAEEAAKLSSAKAEMAQLMEESKIIHRQRKWSMPVFVFPAANTQAQGGGQLPNQIIGLLRGRIGTVPVALQTGRAKMGGVALKKPGMTLVDTSAWDGPNPTCLFDLDPQANSFRNGVHGCLPLVSGESSVLKTNFYVLDPKAADSYYTESPTTGKERFVNPRWTATGGKEGVTLLSWGSSPPYKEHKVGGANMTEETFLALATLSSIPIPANFEMLTSRILVTPEMMLTWTAVNELLEWGVELTIQVGGQCKGFIPLVRETYANANSEEQAEQEGDASSLAWALNHASKSAAPIVAVKKLQKKSGGLSAGSMRGELLILTKPGGLNVLCKTGLLTTNRKPATFTRKARGKPAHDVHIVAHALGLGDWVAQGHAPDENGTQQTPFKKGAEDVLCNSNHHSGIQVRLEVLTAEEHGNIMSPLRTEHFASWGGGQGLDITRCSYSQLGEMFA